MNGRSYSDFFDDDFEVVYEEDLPEIHINGDSDDRKDRCDRSYDDYDDDEDPIDDDEDEEYDSRGDSGRRRGRDSGDGKEKESGQAQRHAHRGAGGEEYLAPGHCDPEDA